MHNTDAPEWVFQIENTVYSDKIFSQIGRLLLKANRFESYCKIASSIILVKHNTEILEDDNTFNEYIEGLNKKWLNENIKNIKTILSFQDIKGHLTLARKSRNTLCHALTLGSERIFGNLNAEKEFEKEIEKHTKIIITGEYYAILIACILTKETFPTINYIQENIDWVLAE